MGIICHWIDNSWSLNKRLIAFREFRNMHTSHIIAQSIILLLNECQLINKVFSIVFYNVSANTVSILEFIKAYAPFLIKYFHSTHIYHILNLCVQEDIGMFNENIEPIRSEVNFLHKRISIGKNGKIVVVTKEFCLEILSRTYQLVGTQLMT